MQQSLEEPSSVPARQRSIPTELRAFLAWENRRAARYQLIDGEVRMMAGGSRAHDLIAMNLVSLLRPPTQRRGCDLHGSNLKVVSPVGLVTYPDLFVRCGPLANEATECDDPILIVEVLSPSTRSLDLVRKRWDYQAIPSLRQLIYIDAAECRSEVVTRIEDGSWRSVFLDSREDAMPLPILDAELPLADVYSGAGFA
jgi:Uma2 family endonuclease